MTNDTTSAETTGTTDLAEIAAVANGTSGSNGANGASPETAETAETEGWALALSLSAGVSDDLHGVFLIMAKAALLAEPCPSDARIARAYGTHSARRARRLLGYFEEQGLIVVHTDFGGKRIVAFPDLGCQTAPGDANAPDVVIVDEKTAAE